MMATPELREIAGGDEELLADLLRDLADSLRKSKALLEGAQSDEDWVLYAHRLKGGALSLGLERISQLAIRAENHGKRDDALLEELEILFEQDVNPN